MKGPSAAGLADLAGVTEAEVRRLVDLGVLVVRHGAGPFLAADVPKVRLATACERAGLPMDGIAAAIRADRLPFASLALLWTVRTAARRGAGEVAGRRGDGPLPGAGWRGAVGARH